GRGPPRRAAAARCRPPARCRGRPAPAWPPARPGHAPAGRSSCRQQHHRPRRDSGTGAGHRSERVTGIEPAPPAWKAGALPLSYTRVPARAAGRERQSAVTAPVQRHTGRPARGPVRGPPAGPPAGSGASGRRDSNPRPPAPKAGALPLRHSPQTGGPLSVPEPPPPRAGRGAPPSSPGAADPPRSWPVVGAVGHRRYTHRPVKTIVAPLEGNKVKLSVEVDEEEFDKAVTAAYRKIAREVRIPGFRPGKAPRKVLEKRLGTQIGREQALNDALPEY